MNSMDNFDIKLKPKKKGFSLQVIARLIANKSGMSYCWEDVLHRLKEGLPMPFKLEE